MKKIRFFACAAACAMLGTMAFMACGSDEEEEEGTPMTEEDVTTITTAFDTMAEYEGGYTVKEKLELNINAPGYESIYNSTLTTDSYITYSTDGTMGYVSTATGTNLYESYNGINLEYYTFKNDDSSYTQYVNYMGTLSTKNYTSVSSISQYYTSFVDLLDGVFGIDLVEASQLTTAAEIAEFWQDKAGESAENLSSSFGFALTFNSGSNTTIEENEETVYRFTANATVSGTYQGMDMNDNVTYYVDVYLDLSDTSAVKINKIVYDTDQTLSMSMSGYTMTMYADSVCTDTFTYAYDSSLVPTDFSAYTA